MDRIETSTLGVAAHRAAPIPLAEGSGSTDDRWPLLATLVFVGVASGSLWALILLALRQMLA